MIWFKHGQVWVLGKLNPESSVLRFLTHLLGFRAQRFTFKGSRLRVTKHFVCKRGVPVGGVLEECSQIQVAARAECSAYPVRMPDAFQFGPPEVQAVALPTAIIAFIAALRYWNPGPDS